MSAIVLLGVFVFGCIFSLILFGFVSVLCVIFLVCMGCVRIMPIIDVLSSLLCSVCPTHIDTIIRNIKGSFPVSYSSDVVHQGPSIYLFHPHGLFTVSHYVHIGTRFTDWKDKNSKGTALHLLWWLPFGKEILETHRLVPSYYEDMKRVLEDKQSLSVTLGGVREIPLACDNKIILNIAHKRGIFKMALETGAPIVPVIAYGENEIYQQTDNWLLYHINRVLIKYNVFLPIPTWKSCSAWMSLAKRQLDHPVYTHVGAPIPVTKKEIPTEDDIIALREAYFSELRALYKRTRPSNYEEEIYIV